MNTPASIAQPSFRTEQADFLLLFDAPATARHFERSKPTLFLPGSLPRAGRLAQRQISLRFCPSSNSSLRFSVSSASLRYPSAFFSETRRPQLLLFFSSLRFSVSSASLRYPSAFFSKTRHSPPP